MIDTDDEMAEVAEKPVNPEETMQFQLGGAERLTDWKAEPSLQMLKGDFEAAKQSHDRQVADIKRWNDLRDVTGEARPPKIKGRSSVQPKLIRRQAEWRYSALSEPFLSSDKLFKVSPATFEDVAAARQHELLLNYQFRTKLNRVRLVDNYVRSVVDEGTCIVRLGWCQYSKKVQVEIPVYSYFPMETQEQAAQLQQALEMRQLDPRTYSEQAPPELQAAVDYFLETQNPTVAEQTGTELRTEDQIVENKPTVVILDPGNFYVDPSCEGDLDKALFAIETFETNKAELLKEGDKYTNLDKVSWESNSTVTDQDHVTQTPDDFQFRDASRKKVVAKEYWGYYDIEGDGTLHPIVATWIGDTLIRLERNPFPDGKLPYVMVPYLPRKRELYGEPDAEVLEDNQKIIGAITRGMIDLMGQSANGQKGFAKGMLDPVNRRKLENGQDYEFNADKPLNQSMVTHTYPEIPQSALLMLNLQNQDAEGLTGVKSFSGGMSGEAYGQVAKGISSMLDAAAKREMSILRRLAMGMSEIGRKIQAMNSEFLSEEEVVRITNEEFVTVKREELAGDFDTIVDISTYEVDNAKAQDLGFMLQTMGPNMGPEFSTLILSEIADLKRMPALAHKLKNWKPQPDPMQQQMQQLELQKLQMEVQVLQSEAMRNQAQAQQAMVVAGQKQLDTVEQERGVKHVRDIQKTQAQAQANQNLEVTKALLKPLKEGEKAPDAKSAIGYNALSRLLEADNLFGPNQT